MEHEKPTNDDEKELFSKLEFAYSRSKDQVWNSIEKSISKNAVKENQKPAKRVSLWAYRSVAAVLILGIGLGLFAKFYTTNIKLDAAEFASHTLPDGSIVHLNAVSSISYAPYWWAFNRAVDLTGEAFFEVKKGERFSVHATLGTTEVLGTSFNIYARGNNYEVHCKTGKVKVSDIKKNQVILVPGHTAKVAENGLLQKVKNNEEETMLSWRLNKFHYQKAALSRVFEDIERHYNVTIRLANQSIHSVQYDGVFSRKVSVDEALEIICLSNNLQVDKQSDGSYLVKEN